MIQQAPWPQELRISKDRRVLTITFDNGDVKVLSAEALRVESPSAEVQGHTPSQKITVTGKEYVKITAVEPVGHYAVRILFDDGHNTGIYTWEYLYNFPQK
jgi:DUF971 family protein